MSLLKVIFVLAGLVLVPAAALAGGQEGNECPKGRAGHTLPVQHSSGSGAEGN